jgi:hypothetical protein
MRAANVYISHCPAIYFLAAQWPSVSINRIALMHPTHPTRSAHCVFHGQQVHASWECLFLSAYGALFQVHVSKVVSDLDVDAEYSLNGARDIHRKKTNTKCVSAYSALVNLGIVVVATVLVAVLLAKSDNRASVSVRQRTLCAESPLCNHNNKHDIDVETS